MLGAGRIYLVWLGLVACIGTGLAADEERGRAFVAWDDFSSWQTENKPNEGGWSLASSPIEAAIEFDQLILSWNVSGGRESIYSFSVQVLHGSEWSSSYVLGQWAPGAGQINRTSIGGQKDELARVSTDTLVLSKPAQTVRVRVEVGQDRAALSDLELIGLSFLDSGSKPSALKSDRAAWGVELAVPQLCQMDYKGGEVWCSPTRVGMVLSHWANVKKRSELRLSVPSLAAEVFDPDWNGTGNWPFNTAFAGSFDGIRGYVVRLSDVMELEDFISVGIPVTVSVAYSVLKRSPSRSNDGHLVVCVGFTNDGNIIVNDPARNPEVRWVYDRADFVAAWGRSKNTTYLIYPDSAPLPADPGGLWSISSR
jgi:hypothetical protein